MQAIEKIIVVFKTHLDIGFTDFASEVIRKYNEVYIPRAIAVGEELAAMGREEGFMWTTGSWLIYQYLEQAGEKEKARAERAIANGMLRWHALPFTMHSECADDELYRYGLSLSQELDERFGIKTTGAKNTDVPGHTRAIVPLLCEAGVDFLHIGVNAASTPPDVPELFRWRTTEGEAINVMYAKGDYGAFSVLPGTGTAICFAHTGDNLGPQSAQAIIAAYDELRAKHPDAMIRAGSLNEVAQAVKEIEESLPVVTQEIGDSWIHGVGTDPQKMSQYRALLRLARGWDGEQKRALYRHLVMIPEHTWGLDEKTHLRENSHYSREEFDALRGAANYRKMEASWQEQRDYILDGVAALDAVEMAQAAQAITQWRSDYPCLLYYSKTKGNAIAKNGWKFAFDEYGTIVHLEKNGTVYADEAHRLCEFLYEVFSEKEVLAFGERYQPRVFDWGLEDQGKIGLGAYMERYRAYGLQRDGIYENENEIVLPLSSNAEASQVYGCPPKCTLRITPEEDRVLFDFAWYGKPALRIPEALWLGFCPTRPLTGIAKLGSVIDPLDVISNGNREMHCTQGLLEFENINLHTLDAPLVAIEKPACYAFYNKNPDTGKGIWVNLFNNQWGTNFPMWNEGDGRARFVVESTLPPPFGPPPLASEGGFKVGHHKV